MIQSMTGYAAADHIGEDVCYTLELRTLNNRYLKLSLKLPDHLQFLEGRIDRQIRGRLVRGSVTYTLRLRRDGAVGLQPINAAALRHYLDQLAVVAPPNGVQHTVDLAALALLPGVCGAEPLDDRQREAQQTIVADLTDRALDALIRMRREEGAVLREDLGGICDALKSRLDQIERRVPAVVQEYQTRLRSRVAELMQDGGFELEADGLMREVAIFAERSDVSEEVARLRSHLEQFEQLCQRDEAVGRTLDFLTQELLREANTIASKSNDGEIARGVVEIKGLIDRLREQVQNVE